MESSVARTREKSGVVINERAAVAERRTRQRSVAADGPLRCPLPLRSVQLLDDHSSNLTSGGMNSLALALVPN